MTIDDYDEVYALWKKIKGFGIRSIDDSREGSSAGTTAEGAVSITSAWMKSTGAGGSARIWSSMR